MPMRDKERAEKKYYSRRTVVFIITVLAVVGIALAITTAKSGTLKSSVFISFHEASKILYLGNDEKLEVSYYPENMELPVITWKSSDETVATVDSNGMISPVAEGKAMISATTEHGQEVICNIDIVKPEKTIYFTFDDGPSPNVTPELLKLLKKNNVRATFFLIGQKAEKYPDIVREMAENNNTIAVHTYTHDYVSVYAGLDSYMRDFNSTSQIITEITGKAPLLCRMPGGSNNSYCKPALGRSIISKLRSEGIGVADWNASYGDSTTKPVTAEELADRVINQIEKLENPIILAHDSESKEVTYEATKILIDEFKKKHYAFDTVDRYPGKLPLFLR